jgi:hypothetical protein
MKKMLLIATAFVSMSAVVFAQQVERIEPVPTQTLAPLPVFPQIPLASPTGASMGVSSAAETRFVWDSRHFTRVGPGTNGQTDSNIANLIMPLDLGNNLQVRGFGQIFAPGAFYDMYKDLGNPNFKNANALEDRSNGVLGELLPETFATPADYYNQFQGAGAFTIDTVIIWFFKNPNAGVAEHNAMFRILSTRAPFNSATYFKDSSKTTSYKRTGFAIGRQQLDENFTMTITPDDLENTLSTTSINPFVQAFDPPLSFPAGTAVIGLVSNEEAPALTQPVADDAEYQVYRSFWDFANGATPGFAQNRSLGLVMFRNPTNDADTLQSLYKGLQFGTTPAVQDLWMLFTGTVELGPSGVSYHFGREASSQGLGQVTPNPAVSNARLPFSLTELANVTVDLFDVNGQMVKNLVTAERYVPGSYSVALPIDQLQSGSYLVRMTANSKVYTMKFNVSK